MSHFASSLKSFPCKEYHEESDVYTPAVHHPARQLTISPYPQLSAVTLTRHAPVATSASLRSATGLSLTSFSEGCLTSHWPMNDNDRNISRRTTNFTSQPTSSPIRACTTTTSYTSGVLGDLITRMTIDAQPRPHPGFRDGFGSRRFLL